MNMSLYWENVNLPSGKSAEIKKRSAELRGQAIRDLKAMGLDTKCLQSTPKEPKPRKK